MSEYLSNVLLATAWVGAVVGAFGAAWFFLGMVLEDDPRRDLAYAALATVVLILSGAYLDTVL